MRGVLAILLWLFASPAWGNEDAEPGSLVDALFVLQDRAARGDREAGLAHRRLADVLVERIVDGRAKLEALHLVDLALSGADIRLSGTHLERSFDRFPDTVLLRLTLALVRRDRESVERLAPLVALERLPRRTSGLIRLAHASVLADRPEERERAVAMLRRVVLSLPGTLIEEAATRRLFALALAAGRGPQAMVLARGYLWRFRRSPFRSGLVRMMGEAVLSSGTVIRDEIDWTWSLLDAADRRFVRFETLRRLLVAGRVADARSLVAPEPLQLDEDDRFRLRIFALIANVTTADAAQVATRMRWVDENLLLPKEVALLHASRRLAEAVLRPLENVAEDERVRGAADRTTPFMQRIRERIEG